MGINYLKQLVINNCISKVNNKKSHPTQIGRLYLLEISSKINFAEELARVPTIFNFFKVRHLKFAL